jgi:O-6-methylguanine DNA methyltransferase
VSVLRHFWFAHRFLRAGLLAEGDRLVLIDIGRSRDEFLAGAARGSAEDEGPFRALTAELAEYLDGTRRVFTVAAAPGGGVFSRAVLECTARVPFGQVATYADVARAAGSPRALRAAGNALARNPFPIVIPCHRVVKSGMLLGGFGGGVDLKRKLLAHEGLSFDGERVLFGR